MESKAQLISFKVSHYCEKVRWAMDRCATVISRRALQKGLIMANAKYLKTSRLSMIATTAEHLRAELEEPNRLAHLLDAEVSSAWPLG
jgi:hypothetical protein